MLFNCFLQLYMLPIGNLFQHVNITPELRNPVLPNYFREILHDATVVMAYVHYLIVLVVHFQRGHPTAWFRDNDVVHCCRGGSGWGLAIIGVVCGRCCR